VTSHLSFPFRVVDTTAAYLPLPTGLGHKRYGQGVLSGYFFVLGQHGSGPVSPGPGNEAPAEGGTSQRPRTRASAAGANAKGADVAAITYLLSVFLVLEPETAPGFAVISGAAVHRALEGRHTEVLNVIEAAYRLHGDGDTVNPPSYFLEFPDRPSARIIALPASVGGKVRTDGIKWISSFPENVTAGIPRASAVLILNDHDTGYPLACLEGSIISAARTAASAALAADRLCADRPRPARIGFVGGGLIARFIHSYLAGTGWLIEELGVYDISEAHAAGFAGYLGTAGTGGPAAATVTVHRSAADLIRASDLVVFATVAAVPHVTDRDLFRHNPVVLHISLRDLAPAVILGAVNVVDDVDHCLRARTSLELAEHEVGNRSFVDGTLYDVLTGRLRPPADRPVVFSPFGLGVLDIALGRYVYDVVRATGQLTIVDQFFHEMRRYG